MDEFLAALRCDDRPLLNSILLGPHGRVAAEYLLVRYALETNLNLPNQIGHYLLLDAGTEGGFAIVYRAWNVELKCIVALKISRHGTNDNAVSRFLEEAQTVARLHHPNIIPIYEFALWNGTPYFTMPWCERGCLQQLPPTEAAQRMLAVAEAIAFAHSRGVWHMDLKPSNILLDENGQPLVADFGLALRPDEVDGEIDGRRGTPCYMSPEQATQERREITAATDVYGLGAVLYFLLTGQPPVKAGATPQETLSQAAVQKRLPPRKLNRIIPQDLDAICQKCLHLDPSRRYSTVEALSADLRAWLTFRPTLVRPPWWPRRVMLWCCLEPFWALILATTVVMVVLFGVIAYQHLERAREQLVAQQRAELFRELASEPMDPPSAGWRERVLDQVRRWREEHSEPDLELRDRVVSLLRGVDVRPLAEWNQRHNVEVSSVAFDPTPRQTRVLLGGLGEGQPTRMWYPETEEVKELISLGPGPVGFRRGRPIQFAAPDGSTPELWQLEADRRRLLALSFAAKPTGPLAVLENDLPALAMTADGGRLAAASDSAVAVWDGNTGERLLERTTVRPRAITLSSDGRLLALGEEKGRVRVISLQGGPDVVLASPHEGNEVQSVAFDPSGKRLAAGYLGYAVVFRLDGQILTYCHGGYHATTGLAWSPNGTTLMVASHLRFRLHDSFSGKSLLDVPSERGNAVAFAADGRVVVGGRRWFGTLYSTRLWRLESGLGLYTLPGLVAPTQLAVLDDRGTTAAVLTHSWQVVVYDLETGALRHSFPVPGRQPGDTTDNVALAFSPNGQSLAVSSGPRATEWDVASGTVSGSWHLPPGGVVNTLVHTSRGWLLFRAEGGGGRRIATLWELRPGSDSAPVSTWPTAFRRITRSAIAPDRDRVYFFACGAGDERHLIALTRAGTAAWELRMDRPNENIDLELDMAGESLFVRPLIEKAPAFRLDPQSGRQLDTVDSWPLCYSSEGRVGLFQIFPFQEGLYRQVSVASLGLEREYFRLGPILPFSRGCAVTRDGNRLFFPDEQGAAVMCVVPEVMRQLRELGLAD